MGAPRIFGRYALYEPIASGGMASVHLARLVGPGQFNHVFAVKRLHEQFARDPEFVQMFLEEAQLTSRIRHPNVVATLDTVFDGNELFLVMEFVHGLPLSTLLKRERQRGTLTPIPVVCQVMAGVLRGLQAAHSLRDDAGERLGVVHRDISPQNILVGADGHPRVIDFGVAKARGRAKQTRSGVLKGKLQYLAPEQLRGKNITASVDLFAAGIVLWEMLTGRGLFRGATEAEILIQLMTLSPPAPSSFNATIPPALDALVLRGLARDPAARFPDAAAMAAALERICPPRPPDEVRAWLMSLCADVIEAQALRLYEAETDTALTIPLIASPTAQPPAPVSVAPSSPGALPPPAPVRRFPMMLAAGAVGAAILGVASARLLQPGNAASAGDAAASVAPPVASPAASPAPPPSAAALVAPVDLSALPLVNSAPVSTRRLDPPRRPPPGRPARPANPLDDNK